MNSIPVSLIIVSQKRPEHLTLLLQSLRLQTHNNFEAIVVADTLPSAFVNHVKYVPFTLANISAARNAGIAISAGKIVAFCDDDAIPDPPWLTRLVSPFVNPKLGSATGFTRGRNGISRQWGAMRFDRRGRDHPFEIDETQGFQTFPASPDSPIKLLGTNMAFRTSCLIAINGFDENLHFFLDETDAKLRMDMAGWETAIVPDAQVHHLFAGSDRRTRNRVPTDLFQIGASKAYFCKAHMDGSHEPALRDFTNEQLIRLTDMVDQRRLRRRDLVSLMDSLGNGFSEGLEREPLSNRLTPEISDFLRFDVSGKHHVVLCARPNDKKWLTTTIRELVSDGQCVSVIRMSPSPRYFQVRFQDGYWLHKGGLFGKSERSQSLINYYTYKQRFSAEIARIAKLHTVDKILTRPD